MSFTSLTKPRSSGPVTLPDAPRSKGLMRLGDVLIQERTLSTAQVADALEEQKGCDAPLGEIIEAKGLLRKEDVTHALAQVYATQDTRVVKVW